MRSRRTRARLGAMAVGATLPVWIGVQVAVVGYRPDRPPQALYAAVGVAILGLASLRSLAWSREEEA